MNNKAKLKIAMVAHGTSLGTAIAKSIGLHNEAIEAPKQAPNPLSEYRRVKVSWQPLTDKQRKVIKAMQGGAIIESTRGCHRCDGIHLTSQSIVQLKAYGLIEHGWFVGQYSSTAVLTEDGKNYNLEM